MDPVREAILCVDDEAIILLHLAKLLERRYGGRFRYELASNGERALATLELIQVQGVHVGLVITDRLMPGMDGDEFLALALGRYPDMKAIMVSGHGRKVPDGDAGPGDLVGFLDKPVVPEELYRLIELALGLAAPGA